MVISWVMVAVLSLTMIAMASSLTCPSSCSFISPVPYPFGAAPGCGAPGFQISNCSATPQWNLQLGDTSHSYYIKSINSSSNSSNHSSVLSYGYGGSIILSLVPKSDSPFCQIDNPIYSPTAFSSSNLYAFGTADLSFYQDRYLLFNCSATTNSSPSSGVISWSSTACTNYLKYCNLSSTHPSLEYTPDKDLYLSTLLTTYNCSFYRRFIIANDDDPVQTWIAGTQFVWGPVKDADSCSTCQNTGGTCGYSTQDNSFLCYCGDDIFQTDCGGGGKGLRSKQAIVGALCGVVIFLLTVASSAFYLYRRHYYWRVFGNHERLKLDGLNQGPIEFPYVALAVATKSFGMEIGHGAFGRVYKGKLLDGNEVAVKVLDASMSQSNEQFVNEVSTIGNIHHVNVARLFGFCVKGSKRILVYEYVSNGSLEKYLFSCKQPSEAVVLSWKQRFSIALGIARGLSYMHEECRSCIIHCDIKPQNILLDSAFCPKIADFGLARLLTRDETRILTHVRGTPGYVAPEFWSLGSGPLTAKFDVYSYGMMLLEIVRGKRGFQRFDPFSLEESEGGLDEFVSVSVDERIVDEADLVQAEVCTQIALWCIQEDPSMRPAMSRVVQYLQGTAPVPSQIRQTSFSRKSLEDLARLFIQPG